MLSAQYLSGGLTRVPEELEMGNQTWQQAREMETLCIGVEKNVLACYELKDPAPYDIFKPSGS